MSSACVQCTCRTISGAICLRKTAHGHKCAQHLRAEDGLLIARSTLADAGLGLFSTVARQKGDRIAPYTGIHVRLRAADERYGGAYVLQVTRTQFVDAAHPASGAARYSNTARAINVARKQCRGNNAHFEMVTVTPSVTFGEFDRARGVATPCIVATRSIKAGEEVFTAYGRSYSFPPLPRGTAASRRRRSI
jgi:SET domain-containing protein